VVNQAVRNDLLCLFLREKPSQHVLCRVSNALWSTANPIYPLSSSTSIGTRKQGLKQRSELTPRATTTTGDSYLKRCDDPAGTRNEGCNSQSELTTRATTTSRNLHLKRYNHIRSTQRLWSTLLRLPKQNASSTEKGKIGVNLPTLASTSIGARNKVSSATTTNGVCYNVYRNARPKLQQQSELTTRAQQPPELLSQALQQPTERATTFIGARDQSYDSSRNSHRAQQLPELLSQALQQRTEARQEK